MVAGGRSLQVIDLEKKVIEFAYQDVNLNLLGLDALAIVLKHILLISITVVFKN